MLLWHCLTCLADCQRGSQISPSFERGGLVIAYWAGALRFVANSSKERMGCTHRTGDWAGVKRADGRASSLFFVKSCGSCVLGSVMVMTSDCMDVCLYVCVCWGGGEGEGPVLSCSLPPCLSVCISTCLSLCICISTCLSLHLYFYLSVCLSVCLFACCIVKGRGSYACCSVIIVIDINVVPAIHFIVAIGVTVYCG